MNDRFIQNYLCNIHIDNKVYTTTKNQRILSAFNINCDQGFFDFRSKSIIDSNNYNKVEPLYVTLDHNPYVCEPTGKEYDQIIDTSIKVCSLYLLTPADTFSNTFNDNSFKYNLVLSTLEICPFFDKHIFNIYLTDDKAKKILIEDNFDVIQRICISLIHEEAGITQEQLLNTPVDALIKQVKSFWVNALSSERVSIINTLREQLVKVSDLSIISAVQQEINYYENISLETEVDYIQYVGDIYRYFPFNNTGDRYNKFIKEFVNLSYLKLTSVNRWHHKLLVTIAKILPENITTYFDIEGNDQVLLDNLFNKKVELINFTKNDLIKLLENEIIAFKSQDTKDLPESIIKDMEDMKQLVIDVDAQFNYISISDIINYWPPILGGKPEIFA